jgi:very-short-patch-repair endonuclease
MQSWKPYAVQQYVDEKRSFHSIGRELGKNPKTIRDAVIKAGCQPRSKSQAQKLHVAKHGPPIQRPRTDEEKRRISDGHARRITSMSHDEIERWKSNLRQRATAQWAGLDKDAKELLMAPMREGAKAQVGRGSKGENKIGDLLREHGYNIERRSRAFSRPFEIDILLIKERVAIEVDGPTHFDPIYGTDHLARTTARDGIKNAFLTQLGVHVIRVQDRTTSYSLSACVRATNEILEILKSIDGVSPTLWTVQLK